MEYLTGRALRRVGGTCAWLVAVAGHADGAIVYRSGEWDVPAGATGLVIDLEAIEVWSGAGPAALESWHLRVFGDPGLHLAGRHGDAPAARLMRYSMDPGQSGPGSLPLELVVGPFSDFGSGAASFGEAVGEWRLNATNYFGFTFVSRAGDVHYGWGRMDIGADAGIRTIAELAWEGTPGLGIQVGHVPSGGPVVLLGIAALVGGPRRTRSGAGSCADASSR